MAPLPLRSARQRQRKTSTAGTFLVSPIMRLEHELTLSGNKKNGNNCCPDCSKFIRFDAPSHDDKNDFFNDLVKLEEMVPSYPCPTLLRDLGSCTRWAGLNLRASQTRIASCIPCRVFLRQRIAFSSFTSSFSLGPCLGLFVMIYLSDAVLSAGDMWFAGSSLRHFSFLGLALIHSHRRTDIILLLFADGEVTDVSGTFLTHDTSSGEAFCH